MSIGAYEPGMIVIDVPSVGLCRFTPAEARAYIALVEAGASEEELVAWIDLTFGQLEEEDEERGT